MFPSVDNWRFTFVKFSARLKESIMTPTDPPEKQPKLSFKLSIDLRVIIILLLVVIAALVVIWKPWQAQSSSERTVSVTGETTLTAEPDEFVFSPSYDVKNPDRPTALKEISQKSDDIVRQLKGLGVTDKQIKTNASGYDQIYIPVEEDTSTYTLQLTITLNKRDLAQKVQDYLVTTSPSGSVTPQYNFSDQMRKSLENQARDSATKDARSKADVEAKNLGFKVGKVKSVTDSGGVNPYPLLELGAPSATGTDDKTTQLAVQPGENKLSYSVTVIYFIR